MTTRRFKRLDNVSSKLEEVKEYDIALSFAGEDHNIAEALANALSARGIKYFNLLYRDRYKV